MPEERYCCRGYCIDLLRQLSAHCNFTYSLHLTFDEYGALQRNNESNKQVRAAPGGVRPEFGGGREKEAVTLSASKLAIDLMGPFI